MKYNDARASTDAQDLGHQGAHQGRRMRARRNLLGEMTGSHSDLPQLKKLMGKLATGDRVIIPAVDRLSHDTTVLVVIARDMQRAGAGSRSLAEPVVGTISDFAEPVLAMLDVAAKLERRRIIERIARGRADAKERGVGFGRKPILTPRQMKVVSKLVEAGEAGKPTSSISRRFDVSQATISRLIYCVLHDLPSHCVKCAGYKI